MLLAVDKFISFAILVWYPPGLLDFIYDDATSDKLIELNILSATIVKPNH